MYNVEKTNTTQSAKISLLNIPVMYGENIIDPGKIEVVNFGEIANTIESDEIIKQAVQEIRSETDDDKRKMKKKKLPYFTAAVLKGYRGKEYFQSAEVLIFDIDHLGKYDLDEIREELEAWKYTSAVFTSPSGHGLKLVIKINRPILVVEEYYSVYREMVSHINDYFNIKLDPATCDPARACFLSHDENIYVNEDAECFNIDGLYSPEKTTAESKRDRILNNMSGVPEGERHNAMVSQIGMYISRGFDKEFIRNAVYGINLLNNPPFTDKEFDEEFESIYNSLTEDKNKIVFYTIHKSKNKDKIMIDSAKLIKFLAENGFRKHNISNSGVSYVRLEGHILKVVSINDIKDFINSYIVNSRDQYRDQILDALIKGNKTFLTDGALGFLPTIDPKTIRGTKDLGYLFFDNVYVEITADNIEVHNYSEMKNAYVWEDSIISKDIDVDIFNNDSTPSEYSRMISLICRNEESWYNAMCCSIGYIAHDYKDKATAKAVIFCDEEIPAADDSNGGTGKSLVCEGLRYIRNTCFIDGKNYRTDSAFIFQNINLNTEVVVIDDARKSFDFESLLSGITSDLTIEKKHQAPFTIPFEKSPKFMITTNYTINGIGNSYDRRKHEIEFSNYFNKNHTPLDEFGHRLFDEWNDVEWTRFYKDMATYIQMYLANGLVTYEVKNLKVRRLIDLTCQQFLDFVEDKVRMNTEYKKKELLAEFKQLYPEFQNLQINKFTRWLKTYANTYELAMDERKSGGNRFVQFSSVLSKDIDKNDDFDTED